jgi:hypothetical protein
LILDRRAGQGNAGIGLKLLDRFGLPGGRILDGLRLVEHDQAPRHLPERGRARQIAVTRDYQVRVRQHVGIRIARIVRAQLLGRSSRRMDYTQLDIRRKSGNFRNPVGEQRGRGHEKTWPPLAFGLALQHEQKRKDLDSLAKPHVVGKAGPKPELSEQIEPLHARQLIWPQ